MADASWTRGSSPDDGWGPATSVRSASADAPAGRSSHVPTRARNGRAARPVEAPVPSGLQRPAAPQSARERLAAVGPATREQERGRGLPGWLALLVMVAITVLGLLVDSARGEQLGTGFNVGIIAGSIIAILAVRRSGMFPVVVAPPIVYALAAGISLYLRSDGLNKRNVLIDAAANWLVYGFPAIAAATAGVLIIAGIRLVIRR